MARPREYDKRVTTAIRFEPMLHEILRETADDLGVSVNWLVTRLVTEGLERLIPVDEMRLTQPPRTARGSNDE
jgi:hypothetical protein